MPGAPPTPDEPWDPARALPLAQASACRRGALERDPGEIRALFALYRSFGARRMDDARASVAAMMRRAWAEAVGGGPGADGPAGPEASEVAPPAGWDREGGQGLATAVADLIRRGHPEAAARLLDEARSRGLSPSWTARDRVAVALLHLGRPAEARALWLDATDPPSPGLKAARLATAALAALDFTAARRDYRAALEIQPDLGEAWFGLAWLHTQAGERAEARRACQRGLACRLTPAESHFLRNLARLVE
jgi:tetratricopeptide (TPR) repeat protein